jgi:zinc/manganese transport system substrate-binding protein
MKYLVLILISFSVFAQSTVVTTLPELKWVVDEIVGSSSSIKSVSLLTGNEDAHYVDATPSFTLKMSKADLLVVNGLELEIGWIPKIIQMSGNSKIQFRSTGYCDTSTYIEKLQAIKNFNRSMGEVHALGNPHFTLSLVQMKNVSKKILECLKKLGPKHSKVFESNYESLNKKFDQHLQKLKEKISSISDAHFMTYHQEFVYYFKDFNLKSMGTLEKVPGILPSASHLLNISKLAKEKNVKLVLASITNPKKYLEKFKEITSIPYLQLPLHMNPEFKDYWEFHNFITSEILKNVKGK